MAQPRHPHDMRIAMRIATRKAPSATITKPTYTKQSTRTPATKRPKTFTKRSKTSDKKGYRNRHHHQHHHHQSKTNQSTTLIQTYHRAVHTEESVTRTDASTLSDTGLDESNGIYPHHAAASTATITH